MIRCYYLDTCRGYHICLREGLGTLFGIPDIEISYMYTESKLAVSAFGNPVSQTSQASAGGWWVAFSSFLSLAAYYSHGI